MSSQPRILVLILASDTNPLYCQFQELWKQYMNSAQNIDCYFYKAHPNLSEEAFVSDKNTIFVKCEDTLDTCYEKLLRVLNFLKPNLSKYDYIFRTNLSSFVYFPHYIEFCKSLPKANCCSALIGTTDYGLEFPAGAGFTLTPDLALRLLEQPPPLEVQDDVSVGRALNTWGIKIIPAPRMDILLEVQLPEVYCANTTDISVFHYRLKNLEGKRELDSFCFNILISRYYNS